MPSRHGLVVRRALAGRGAAVRLLAAAGLLASPAAVPAQGSGGAIEIGSGLGELRHVVGSWDVRTELLNPGGSIARTVDGEYEFDWAIPGAVVRGLSRQPELNAQSAILLYVRPASAEIEMVSVDRSGTMWVMTGQDGSGIRTTADRAMSDGLHMRLRFIREAITRDRFESRMEYSTDGGATWTPGNRQVFTRRTSDGRRRFLALGHPRRSRRSSCVILLQRSHSPRSYTDLPLPSPRSRSMPPHGLPDAG